MKLINFVQMHRNLNRPCIAVKAHLDCAWYCAVCNAHIRMMP